MMTALTRLNPFRRTEQELERWFPTARFTPLREMERAMENLEELLGRWPNGGKETLALAEWRPLVDVTEDDKEYLVKAELPEVKKEEIKVTVQNGALTIAGERKIEKEEKNKKYHRVERAYGSFERSFTVPEDADANKITSEFKDGVLTVHLPKAPTAKPKTIEVKTA
jgi:HSP20 family protein